MTQTNEPRESDRFDDPSDDPRLTAYALGELAAPEHAAARAAIEERLAGDPVARAFVEETRALAVTLRDGYLAVPAASLTDAQRAEILARAAAPVAGSAGRAGTVAAPRGRVLRVPNWSIPAAAAAALLVGVTFSFRNEIGSWWSGDRDTARATDEEGSGLRYAANREFGHRWAVSPAGQAPTPPRESQLERRNSEDRRKFNDIDLAASSGPKSTREPVRLQPMPAPDAPPEATRPAPSRPAAAISGPMPEPAAAPKPASDPGAPDGAAFGVSQFSNGGGGGGGGARVRAGDEWSFTNERAENLLDGTGNGVSVYFEYAVDKEGSSPDGALADDVRNAVRRLQELGYVGNSASMSPERQARAKAVLQDGRSASLALLVRNTPLSADESAQVVNVLQRLCADGRITAEQAGALERHARRPRETVAPGESYAAFADNPFLRALDAPLSTFGIDVDTASYANVRRFLDGGRLPPPQAVRIEEWVNYFPYRYTPPQDGAAFAANVEVAGCPWNGANRLVRVALKGRVEDVRERPAANLVFLIDVSGSMSDENKLPLLVQSMKQLVPTLGARDKVAIVTYAGEAGVALPPTRGDEKETILRALDALSAGGSTNGAAGIETAYRLASEGFLQGGVNRVILATDGDFNVGVSDDDALVRIISEKARSKVFLSVLGFGQGNLQDKKMEGLADRGNGHYAYIDSLREGRKVLVDEAASTLVAIAKDVKIQIEFNPLRVASYRLLGYENRTMAAADFANDAKDAGDLGAGHAVTALYEIVPTGSAEAAGQALRYQKNTEATPQAHSDELCVIKLRWKHPEGDESTYREVPVRDSGAAYAKASADFKFAAAVASFGMILRGSPHRGQATLDGVMELASDGLDWDEKGLRAEFIDLVRKAKALGAR